MRWFRDEGHQIYFESDTKKERKKNWRKKWESSTSSPFLKIRSNQRKFKKMKEKKRRKGEKKQRTFEDGRSSTPNHQVMISVARQQHPSNRLHVRAITGLLSNSLTSRCLATDVPAQPFFLYAHWYQVSSNDVLVWVLFQRSLSIFMRLLVPFFFCFFFCCLWWWWRLPSPQQQQQQQHHINRIGVVKLTPSSATLTPKVPVGPSACPLISRQNPLEIFFWETWVIFCFDSEGWACGEGNGNLRWLVTCDVRITSRRYVLVCCRQRCTWFSTCGGHFRSSPQFPTS